jgi:hypothetical protein
MFGLGSASGHASAGMELCRSWKSACPRGRGASRATLRLSVAPMPWQGRDWPRPAEVLPFAAGLGLVSTASGYLSGRLYVVAGVRGRRRLRPRDLTRDIGGALTAPLSLPFGRGSMRALTRSERFQRGH